MKKYNFFIILVLLTISICSCDDDEESTPSFNFLNQTAQGSIEGEDWTFESGLAEDLSGSSAEGLSIQLSDEDIPNICDEFAIPTQIRFAIFSNTVGVKPISDNTTDFANFIGVGFVTGAIEITSINNTTLSGKVDVSYTDPDTNVTSSINGNFSVPVCGN